MSAAHCGGGKHVDPRGGLSTANYGSAVRMVIVVGGVKFDGCRASDGTLLEAKGPGYGQFLVSDIEKKAWFGGDGNIMDQARRQASAAKSENQALAEARTQQAKPPTQTLAR